MGQTCHNNKRFSKNKMNCKTIFVVTLLVLMCTGCMSIKAKRQMFVDMKNSEIGKPFYEYEKDGMKEYKSIDSESEFIQEPIPESGCGVAWIVDTIKRGPYHHRNGMTFQIEGFKKSWRFLGNPENCKTHINWLGPW